MASPSGLKGGTISQATCVCLLACTTYVGQGYTEVNNQRLVKA